MLKAIEFIKEKRIEYDQLTAQREKLEKECDQFDLKKPEFVILDSIGVDIKEFENNWVIYEEFNTEMQSLADEEWIVFRGTTLEKLRFGDLITVSSNIITNVDQLKALNNKAQGEVTIREAIQELEMWAAQTEFTFAEYRHSNGNNMKVIRDWKESINSFSTVVTILCSRNNCPHVF
ncbi:hypothetical protein DICVIV_07083 [Dictyocaulus viviparus]|uniref:Uncharacterized protein n=1 Tax=Dictyocaulus viviparus TaxID=29172 RepID=A0A0D8XWX3_DICVI|nr:hypothetical protein DICVIV_07083 [Dictyocaulus viviparus]